MEELQAFARAQLPSKVAFGARSPSRAKVVLQISGREQLFHGGLDFRRAAWID